MISENGRTPKSSIKKKTYKPSSYWGSLIFLENLQSQKWFHKKSGDNIGQPQNIQNGGTICPYEKLSMLELL